MAICDLRYNNLHKIPNAAIKYDVVLCNDGSFIYNKLY